MARLTALVRAVLLLAAAPSLPVHPGIDGADDAKAEATDGLWAADGGSALEAAPKGLRLVVLHFPAPVADASEPDLADLKIPEALHSRLIFARVRADEVRELRDRFKVDELPALVLLDPYAAPLWRWTRTWAPRAVVSKLQEADRRLARMLERLDQKAGDAEAAWEAARVGEAIRGAREVLDEVRGDYPQVRRARKLLGAVRARAQDELLELLGNEGIASDRDLLAGLERLRERFRGLDGFERRLDREKMRLRDRSVGGKGRSA